MPSILLKYPDYEATIGIEVHVQLTTKSKIFCSCSNDTALEPNSTICQICTGQPGVLPILNRQVVDYAIMAGLATNCTINTKNEFARKHYFYPDLPKNYQITQSDKPICTDGKITIKREDGSLKDIRIMRIHMEEDAGKNIHSSYSDESFVDFNRTGTPLLEIVTYPDISDTYEAKAYLKALHNIVTYLGISSGNMEEGEFRADTNISVRKRGATKLGTKCELKNINSFKFIGDATEYEIERQIQLVESGKAVIQETRLWDIKEGKTKTMREKGDSADYRYLPDPDIPPLELEQSHIDQITKELPELPAQKFERLKTRYGLSDYEAEILINDKDLSAYYEACAQLHTSPLVINWVLRDVSAYCKDNKINFNECKVTPAYLVELIKLIEQQTITARIAQEIFAEVAQSGAQPSTIVRERGLEQITDIAQLETIVKEIIQAHPQQLASYKAGTTKLFGFFVGAVMQRTQGKAPPQVIQELLKKHLN